LSCFTRAGDSPRNSAWRRAEGQTIGRLPSSQSCGCVCFYEPGDEFVGVHRQTEIGLGLLKRGQKTQRLGRAMRQACERVRLVDAMSSVSRRAPLGRIGARHPAADSSGN
jgi:hypothetical protein